MNLNATRLFRAVLGAGGLLLAPLPVLFFLAEAFAAGLSDSPDVHGPGNGVFIFGLVMWVAIAWAAGLLALPRDVRQTLRGWRWIPAGLLLLPAYPAAGLVALAAARLGDAPGLVWFAAAVTALVAYVYAWSGVLRRWVGRGDEPA